MPQITFEHSANLTGIDYKNLFSDIYHVIAKFPNMGTCKIRAVSHESYYIGTENGENAFAFLRVLMKPNKERTAQFRDNMAKALIPVITRYIDPVKKAHGIKCFPTIEVGTLSEQYYWIEDKI